jgi:hypothetical protein
MISKALVTTQAQRFSINVSAGSIEGYGDGRVILALHDQSRSGGDGVGCGDSAGTVFALVANVQLHGVQDESRLRFIPFPHHDLNPVRPLSDQARLQLTFQPPPRRELRGRTGGLELSHGLVSGAGASVRLSGSCSLGTPGAASAVDVLETA